MKKTSDLQDSKGSRTSMRFLQTALSLARVTSLKEPLPNRKNPQSGDSGSSRPEIEKKAATNTSIPTTMSIQKEMEKITFMDIAIDDVPIPRIKFKMYCSQAPLTCDNFIKLCTGELGFGYAGSRFHRIVPNFIVQGLFGVLMQATSTQQLY